jgi:protein O-mannosyl-transferase
MIEETWKRTSVGIAAIILFVVAAHSPALHTGFIWDDADHLTQNPCVIGPLGFKEIWTTPRAIYYPMVLTVFWALHKFVGLSPLPYHLLNLLMHAGSALLLWRVLRQLNVRAAWFGALLWAVHPVTVQSVAWVTELKNTQSCFFYLLSILLFLKADARRDTDRKHFGALFVMSLLTFVFAITSKTSTVMLPVVLALCLWWKRGTVRRSDLVLLAPFLFIAAVAAGWTVYEQRFLSLAAGQDWTLNWMQRFAVAGWNIWFYLGKNLWPHPLIFIYPRWKIDTLQWIDFVPLVAAVTVLLLLWWKRNGPLRPVFFATIYFVVSLFPVLGFFNVYFFKFSFVSDHFQYLACMGPLALIASAGWSFSRSLRLPQLSIVAAGGAVVLALGGLTWSQATNYRDAETLYRATIERDPSSWFAKFNLGEILLHRDEIDAGIQYLREAARERPNDAKANTGLADALRGKGQTSEATSYYKKALQTAPDDPAAHVGLALALEEIGELEEASIHYKAALQQEPGSSEIHYDLASVLLRTGEIDQATAEIHQALALEPNNSDAHVTLGNVFLHQHDERRAIAEYESALKISPRSALAQNNLAWVLATASDHSLRDGKRAIQLAEESSRSSGGTSALRTLAAAYAETKDFDHALATARHALDSARDKGETGLIDPLQREISLYEAGVAH